MDAAELSTMTLSNKAHGVITLTITLSAMTFIIRTLGINDTHFTDPQYKDT